MKAAAGIVTYNPDVDRLRANAVSLLQNVDLGRLYVIDNGSDDYARVMDCLAGLDRVELVLSECNMGIAWALNTLCRTAAAAGFDWILSMDQDSVMSAGYMEHYARLSGQSGAGMICCRVEDMNYGRMYNAPTSGCDEVQRCITSGSMVRLDVWKQIGGFDESMFIDGVDFDYSLRVKAAGYSILRTCDAFITHKIGNGRMASVLGRRALILNHSPLRLYYIARNYLYLGRKFGQIRFWRHEVFKRLCLTLCFEKDRSVKLKAMLQGIRDARNGKMGACRHTF